MTSLGESLRRERLKQKLEYEVISQELKISPRILQAMEEERFDKLPGGVFARGFVRQYARLLGLDEEEAVSAAQRLVEPKDVPAFAAEHASVRADAPREPRHVMKAAPIEVPRMSGWQAISDDRRSSTLTALALVVGVMLLCSVVYGWWQRDRHSGAKPEPSATASMQAAANAAVPGGPVASDPAPAASTAAPASTPPETASASPSAIAPEAAPALSQPAQSTAPVTAPSTTPVNSSPAGPVHVELTATEPVWVTALSDGKFAFSGVIGANQTKTLDATGTAEIKVGNAGGVRILLNGKSIGEVGPRGQVRTIQFTSGGFHILVAAPKVLDDPIGLL